MNDAHILRRHGRYTVLADSQLVILRDGTHLALYRVLENVGKQGQPGPSRFLRAVLDEPLINSHVIDVRDLASTLDAEIRSLPVRDEQGVVALTLRQFYPTGAGLLTKIVEESLAKLPQPQELAHAA